MALGVGSKIPSNDLITMGAEGPETVNLAKLSDAGKVVVFAVPGAFTPTCHSAHMPSFVRTADDFRAKGVSAIACVSVNDAFVMGRWADETGANDAGIMSLADGDGSFTKAMGMDFTAPPVGLIGRSKRYAMIVENGVITALHEEENPGVCEVSGGEALLAVL